MVEIPNITGLGRYRLAAVSIGVIFLTGLVAQSLGTGPDSMPMESRTYPQAEGGGYDLGLTASVSRDSPEKRKTATSVHIDMETGNVEQAVSKTKQLAADYGGILEHESFNRDQGVRASLRYRIPDSNFSAFTDEVEGRWKVESKNVDTEDVTQRYTELDLELKNKRKELRRLESMMNETDEVESLIKIQKRMSELRSRIQFLENQLSDLDRRVDYTRVSLSFEEPRPFESEFELRESFRKAYQGFFESLNLMVVGIGYLLPVAILVALGLRARSLVSRFRD